MDPCPFVRLIVGNLALKISVVSKSARSVVHPLFFPCFCNIKLKSFSLQTAVVPYIPPEKTQFLEETNKYSHPVSTLASLILISSPGSHFVEVEVEVEVAMAVVGVEFGI
ncbi:Hypothetical predicted protein [Olea europaea subsp. europaea]|uniref:Uncharacterized protein n=1 Tax=Olea europaea subsp. europaea TaxID=158383 RepID=A0A8S0TN40_OLEEU|nr:Hypothetical predicted protein [Olea europaea subsp. europaea]